VEWIVDHVEQGNRGAFFILEGDRQVAELTYRREHASLVNINHTFVAEHLRERGVARRLLDAAVEWARSTGTKVRSTCPYSSAQFTKDASIRDVLE